MYVCIIIIVNCIMLMLSVVIRTNAITSSHIQIITSIAIIIIVIMIIIISSSSSSSNSSIDTIGRRSCA